MAEVTVSGDRLDVRLSPFERLQALHGDVSVPLSSVTRVETVDHPLDIAHGVRVGTGIPGVMVIGTITTQNMKSFAVIHSKEDKGVVIHLDGERFGQLIIGTDDPERIVTAVEGARK